MMTLTDGTYEHVQQSRTMQEVVCDAADWFNMDSMDVSTKDAKANFAVCSGLTYRELVRRSACDSGDRETAYCSLDNKLQHRMWHATTCQMCKLVHSAFMIRTSSIDYNESSKPTLKSLAHIRSEKSLTELPKKWVFSLFHIFYSSEKFTFHPEPLVV